MGPVRDARIPLGQGVCMQEATPQLDQGCGLHEFTSLCLPRRAVRFSVIPFTQVKTLRSNYLLKAIQLIRDKALM